MGSKIAGKQLAFEALEQKLPLTADLVLDINTDPLSIQRVAYVDDSIYASSFTGSETLIWRRDAAGGDFELFRRHAATRPGDYLFQANNGALLYDVASQDETGEAEWIHVWRSDADQPVQQSARSLHYGYSPAKVLGRIGDATITELDSQIFLYAADGNIERVDGVSLDLACTQHYVDHQQTDTSLSLTVYSDCGGLPYKPARIQTDGQTVQMEAVDPWSLSDGTRLGFSYVDGRRTLGRFPADRDEPIETLVDETVAVPDSSDAQPPTRIHDELFLFAASNDAGTEPWITDGTRDGTRMLRDINPGSTGSGFRVMGRTEHGIVFSADDGVHGKELWVTDGSDAGTTLLRDVVAGTTGSNPVVARHGYSKSPVFGDGLVSFFASTPDSRTALWVTDGTPAGTQQLATLPWGGGAGEVLALPTQPDGRTVLAIVGHRVAPRPGRTMILLSSDGTPAGTQEFYRGLASDDAAINAGMASLSQTGERVLLMESQEWLREIDVASGKAQAVSQLFLDPFNASTAPETVQSAGDRVYMVVAQEENLFSESTYDLFAWDPLTRAASNLGKLTNPGWPPSEFAFETLGDGTVVVVGPSSLSVIRNDQVANTVQLSSPISQRVVADAGMYYIASNQLYYLSSDGAQSQVPGEYQSLIRTNNNTYALTQDGTLVLVDGLQTTNLLTRRGARTILSTSRAPDNAALWITQSKQVTRVDLQTLQTHDVIADVASDASFVADEGMLVWLDWTAELGWRLRALRSDMPEQLVTLHRYPDESGLRPQLPELLGRRVVWQSPTPDGGQTQLWSSDGTTEGTVLLGSFPQPITMTVQGHAGYYAADGIWHTDGTAAGTYRVTGSDDNRFSSIREVTVHGSELYFAGTDEYLGEELFSIPQLSADANRDGQVAFEDVIMLSTNFGRPTLNGRADGDFDEDGAVTFADFLILRAEFGRTV